MIKRFFIKATRPFKGMPNEVILAPHEDPNGDIVKYSDYIAELTQVKAERDRYRKVLEQIKNLRKTETSHCIFAISTMCEQALNQNQEEK